MQNFSRRARTGLCAEKCFPYRGQGGVLFEGAILETGAPGQMFADPVNERTRQFLNACREKPHGLQYNQL
jgi:ABC-type histidine transport system ATPase subunit